MANDTAQPGKPTVVYSPLRLNWKNVVAGSVIALLIVAIGVFAFSYYNPDATPVPPVVIKSGTKSAKVATKSAIPSTQKDETADWKTFNSSAGTIDLQKDEPGVKFSVKFPPNLTTKAKDHNYALVHSTPYRLAGPEQAGEISVLFGAYSQAGKDIVPDRYSNPETATLGGKEASKYVSTAGSQNIVVYYVENSGQNNMAFELRCLFVPKDGTDLEKTCTQIAKSLKFLN